MNITLIKTGGIIPVTKKSEKEVGWSEDEMKAVLKMIQIEEETAGQTRDGTSYQLMNNAGTFSVDLEKVPAKYKKTFQELKDELKIVKR